MINHLYRFRSLYRLLEKDELENQEIYFAKPEELNDPMEGFRDIFWKGDEVVWENLFRHYIVCLDWAYELLLLSREDEPFGWSNIPVFTNSDTSVTPQHKARLDKLIAAFLADDAIRTYISVLARRTVPVRRNELRAYLQFIHFFALSVTHSNYIEHGLLPDRELVPGLDESARSDLAQGKIVLAQISRLETEAPNAELAIDDFFAAHKQMMNELKFINRYNEAVNSRRANLNFVFATFCEEYVERIETLVFPNWYAACFTSECCDSSVWGSYGDRHTAVCLKFKVRASQGKPVLRLRHVNGFAGEDRINSYLNYEFHSITYESRHLPIDFFRSLRLPIPALRDQWYTGRAGNQSPCGDEVFKCKSDWRDRYWKAFYHAITRKMKDWQHEKEYRLILSNEMSEFSDVASRTFQYDFNDLEGVIFGINTPVEPRCQVCKIIEEKCRGVGRHNFKFYQAFYSPASGRIEHAEMSLLKFNLSGETRSGSGNVS